MSHISCGKGIISFERAETNHDKMASPKQQTDAASIYIAHDLHKLSGCLFADNFRDEGAFNRSDDDDAEEEA